MKEKLLAIIKRPAAWITAGVILVSLVLVLVAMTSPTARNDSSGFSANNVYAHSEAISGYGPHSVFDQKFVTGGTEDKALDKVRTYVKTKAAEALQPLGLPVTEVRHQNVTVKDVGVVSVKENVIVPVYNYYAQIEGKSDSYILLMAHYDSAPHRYRDGVYIGKSSGAADDAFGVGTLLEIMRLLAARVAAGEQLENGVKFLFTDAEEPWAQDDALAGLFGATAAVNEYGEWLDGVNVVLNVEARGVRGPLYMFQTSSGNKNLIRLFRLADRPFSFSIASDVYAILTTDTDLSPFLSAGYAGLNFSVLDSLKEYHSPGDIIENVDINALQAYGDQIYPIVTEYTSDAKYADPDYFKSNTDMVFFTFSAHIFISYSQVFSWIIIALLFIGAAAAIYFAHKNKLVNLKKALLALALWFAFILAGAVAGLLLSLLLAWISGVPFNLMNTSVPFGLGFLIIFSLGMIVAAVFLALKLFKKLNIKFYDAFTGVLFLLLAFTLLTGFFLHGGTYLFVFPAIFMAGLLGLTASRLSKPFVPYAKYVLASVALFVSAVLYGYLIYSLFLAVSFGAMAAHLLFAGVLGGLITATAGSMFKQEEKEITE